MGKNSAILADDQQQLSLCISESNTEHPIGSYSRKRERIFYEIFGSVDLFKTM
jgi:hypothetical protein